MEEAKTRIVVRKGSSHAHRCEDEAFSFTYGNITVIAAFDGCSTPKGNLPENFLMGSKSYFASGLFATLFKKIAIHHADYFNSADDVVAIGKFLLRTFYAELKSAISYLELDLAETLSTIVFAVVNTEDKEAYSVMVGDGTTYVDGEIFTEKPVNNAPMYISFFLDKGFDKFWEENVFENYHKVERTISVMSDGIDSFRNLTENRFATDKENEEIVDFLLKDEKLFLNPIGMARKCNILETGRFVSGDDLSVKLVPSDDLSIARIVFYCNL